MQRVMIIRAEPAASATAGRLAEAGHATVKLPLFQFRPTSKDVPAAGFCAVALTSSNAVKGLKDKGWKPEDPEVPVYCIGSRTGEAAKAFGMKNIHSFHGDRNLMISAIANNHGNVEQPVLYPAAKDRAFDLVGALSSKGIQADLVEVYAMEKLYVSDEKIKQALLELGNGTILVHSKRGAEYLNELLGGEPLAGLLANIRFVAISKQAAQPLSNIRCSELLIAKEPNEDAMISNLNLRN